MAKRGLVVGKFYPPHRGHSYLLDAAQAQVDQLHVLLLHSPNEAPNGELRAAWLREMHPRIQVDLAAHDPGQHRLSECSENVLRVLGFPPDLLFGRHECQAQLAHQLGCKFERIRLPRALVPAPDAEIRADPIGNWEFLEPPVRAYYAIRVCFIGAESTGKSTLAASLAAHYGTVWLQEYGREYAEARVRGGAAGAWSSTEFLHIAQMQCRREDEAARRANRVLICDTDALATNVWHRRFLGERSPAVEAVVAAHRAPDLYLLTSVDVPFVQDGTRTGKEIRGWLHDAFLEELRRWKRPYRIISGPQPERFRQAAAYIDALLRTPRSN